MRKLFCLMALAVLAAGCGPAARVSQEDEEVNVGYGTVKKKDLTSSVSTVKVKDNEMASYSNIYDYLAGRVPGVQVTPDHKLVVRGINSINSSTDPLILVDGVEMTDISAINPRDVKTVDVIKDGSAAIYGVRGANGVVLITTFQGGDR